MSGAGRVIAGSARGLRLLAPGAGTRPLADRAKQTLFAILEPDLAGARFLDLFAGSGAAGIEALSRGAAEAVFVDAGAEAVRVAGANLGRADLADRGRVVRADVPAWLRGPGRALGPFDLVLVDPPFDAPGLVTACLEPLGAPDAPPAPALLSPDARVVVRTFWRQEPPAEVGLLASERERRVGEATLTFYRRIIPAEAGET